MSEPQAPYETKSAETGALRIEAGADVLVVSLRGFTPAEVEALRRRKKYLEDRRRAREEFERQRQRYDTNARAYEEAARHPDVPFEPRTIRKIVREAREGSD